MMTSKPSPFNYRDNVLLYTSSSMPFPDNSNPDYLDAVTDEIEGLVQVSHGHAAVLFTSYKTMDMVYERLEARELPYPLFRLNRGGAGTIDDFKASRNGILFATGAMWEGIDIPGDALSMLIMVRLPFAAPDPISEYERTLYPNQAFKELVIIPDMLVRERQGFGRLIRTVTDTGVIAYLDCRVAEGGAYRGHLLCAHPGCRVTSSISDVSAFFLETKNPDYFA